MAKISWPHIYRQKQQAKTIPKSQQMLQAYLHLHCVHVQQLIVSHACPRAVKMYPFPRKIRQQKFFSETIQVCPTPPPPPILKLADKKMPSQKLFLTRGCLTAYKGK